MTNSVYDLIEHVELNKNGWWDAALSNVVMAATWLQGQPVNRAQLGSLMISAFNLNIPSDRIVECVEQLVLQGELIVQDGDCVVPSRNAMDRMESRLSAAQLNEDAVRDAFLKSVRRSCAPHSPEKTWELFNTEYLIPLIDALGARTIQLMGGVEAGDANVAALTEVFLANFDDGQRALMRSNIAHFLGPGDTNVQRYVTEHLDASFLVKASGLTKQAIDGISKFGQKPPDFRLFLDTNFLFSLLNLHENPSNEASRNLGKTIQHVSNRVNIRMHVIPPTIEEIKRTLHASMMGLNGIRMTPVLADVALEVGGTGIVMRFARANQDAPKPISPKEYFEPYIRDLSRILQNKGITVYNDKIDLYAQRQDVIDDLLEMIPSDAGIEKQRFYNSAFHDSVLWHVVKDRRPTFFESPLEAVYWVVTNDYRLINFDRSRQNKDNSAAAICIHPAELIQILRIWEPRTTDTQQALMSALRLPFMFYEFDDGSEDISMRILKALSRFDHIETLDAEAIRDIVLSDAVRSKVETATSHEGELEVIRDALLSDRAEIAARLDAVSRRAQENESALAKVQDENRNQVESYKQRHADAEDRARNLETEVQKARNRQRATSRREKVLERELEEQRAKDRRRSNRISFLIPRGILTVVAAPIIIGLAYVWLIAGTSPLVAVFSICFGFWALTSSLIFTIRIDNAEIKQWPIIQLLLKFQKWIYGAMLTALFSVAVGEIWHQVF